MCLFFLNFVRFPVFVRRIVWLALVGYIAPTGADIIFFAVLICFFAKPRSGFLQILNLPAICFVTSPALEIDFIRIGHIAFFVNCNFVGLNFSAGILVRDSVSKVF